MKLSNYKLGAISYKQLIINNQNITRETWHKRKHTANRDDTTTSRVRT